MWALTGLVRAVPCHAAQRRLYVPSETMAACGLSEGEVFAGRYTPALGKAMAVIKDAAEAQDTTKSTRVVITGHTDLAGDKGYNVGLSLARVVAVGNALVKEGVARSLLVDSWLGEEKPRVSTSDGQREAENRRVEITLKR